MAMLSASALAVARSPFCGPEEDPFLLESSLKAIERILQLRWGLRRCPALWDRNKRKNICRVQFDIKAHRDKVSAKINCAKAHFKALASGDNPAFFLPVRSLDDVFQYEPSST
jgi:hypothetical protein